MFCVMQCVMLCYAVFHFVFNVMFNMICVMNWVAAIPASAGGGAIRAGWQIHKPKMYQSAKL